ncbi:MAG: hypothetical protein GY739_14245 [Mesoflavibacter sp.]|nr:hypothetical protein [Mesoflavibacter sp.]
MKFIGRFVILILIISCSNKENTLEDYANYPVKFPKQKVSSPNGEFSIFIPKDWKWKTEKNTDNKVIFEFEAVSKPNKDGFIDVISILKTESFADSDDLKAEFEYYKNNVENYSSIDHKIVKLGNTEILNQESYFLHIKSNPREYGEIETISFIIDSKNKGEFYSLTASASRTTELKKNMAVLIQSLKTFDYEKNE